MMEDIVLVLTALDSRVFNFFCRLFTNDARACNRAPRQHYTGYESIRSNIRYL